MYSRICRPVATTGRAAQSRLATAPLPSLRARTLATTPTTPETPTNEAVDILTPTPEAADTATSTFQTHAIDVAAAPRAVIPYFVGKNKFQNFGVYQKKHRGGNLKTTEVKLIEGNVGAFKHDLMAALGLQTNEVKYNGVTRHVVVKGHRKPEIMNFLNQMGF